MTGDLDAAHQAGMSGLKTGAGLGGVTGAIGGYAYAKENGLNPWTGEKIQIQRQSVDALIESITDINMLKNGEMQGALKGDASSIFQDLIIDATHIRGNLYQLPDGTYINFHNSTSTGVPTIDINKSGMIYKLRINK
jgi:hypothetical protein